MNMSIKITASEANRSFSKLLREVAKGKRVEITSHGRSVAALVPLETEEDKAAARARQLEALAQLEKFWAQREFKVVGPWTREGLYERD